MCYFIDQEYLGVIKHECMNNVCNFFNYSLCFDDKTFMTKQDAKKNKMCYHIFDALDIVFPGIVFSKNHI